MTMMMTKMAASANRKMKIMMTVNHQILLPLVQTLNRKKQTGAAKLKKQLKTRWLMKIRFRVNK